MATGLRVEALVLGTQPPAAPALVGFDGEERVLVIDHLANVAWLPADPCSPWPDDAADVTSTLIAAADAVAPHPVPPGLQGGFEGRSSVWTRLTDDALLAFGLGQEWIRQVQQLSIGPAHVGDADDDRLEMLLYARMAGVRDLRTPPQLTRCGGSSCC